jgi:uncharacterized protein YjbJ (UPF0337 family)
MNQDQVSGKWKQVKGQIKKQWGKLTDDHIDRAEGNYEILIGKIQERYGTSREQIKRKLDRMTRTDEPSRI